MVVGEGLTTGEGLPRGNALRNVLLGLANATAAVGFILFTSIAWSAALPLAIGLFAGGRIGPRIVRRAPQKLLRYALAVVLIASGTTLITKEGSPGVVIPAIGVATVMIGVLFAAQAISRGRAKGRAATRPATG